MTTTKREQSLFDAIRDKRKEEPCVSADDPPFVREALFSFCTRQLLSAILRLHPWRSYKKMKAKEEEHCLLPLVQRKEGAHFVFFLKARIEYTKPYDIAGSEAGTGYSGSARRRGFPVHFKMHGSETAALRESALPRVQFPQWVAPPRTPNGWNWAVGKSVFDGVASVLWVSSRAA